MSLRVRLVAATVVVALVALVVADIATYSALRTFLSNRVDQTLQNLCPPATPGGPDGGPGAGPGGGQEAGPGACGFQNAPPPSSRASAVFVEQRSSDGTSNPRPVYVSGKYYSPDLPASALRATNNTGTPQRALYTTDSVPAGGPQFRVLVITYPGGDQLIFGQPLDATSATLHDLFLIELAVTAAALLAALLIGIWLVRVGLRPLQRVEDTAEAIADGQLERRVPGEDNRTEVGRLARALNVMLARIERAFQERDATEAELRRSEERLRQFISDASHELRTPLAAVTAYAELYSQGASAHPEDLERVMKGISDESARMKGLVEDLLLLARLDEGSPMGFEPVELVTLSAEAIHAAQTVGPAWPVSLSAAQPVDVYADPQRLRQVLDNLLANVRAHTPAGTSTVVSVRRDGERVAWEVADDGPGLPAGTAAHIFERFYRADPSRSRHSGGAGLGLSIVGAIVSAHGGTVTATDRNGGGASFTVFLPALAEERSETHGVEPLDAPPA